MKKKHKKLGDLEIYNTKKRKEETPEAKKEQNVKVPKQKRKGFFSKLFNGNQLDLEDYKSVKFLNEHWFNDWFAIYIEKPEKETDKEFRARLEGISDSVLNHILTTMYFENGNYVNAPTGCFDGYALGGLSSIQKSISCPSFRSDELPEDYARILSTGFKFSKNAFFIIIRFPNLTKEALKGMGNNGMGLRYVQPNEKREYKFSPLQIIQIAELLRNIEERLILPQCFKDHRLEQQITLISGIKDEIIISDTDGVQYSSYSLKDRGELYVKYPEIHEKMFGMDFIDFAKWIIDKEKNPNDPRLNVLNKIEDQKANADRTRKILKNLGLKLK